VAHLLWKGVAKLVSRRWHNMTPILSVENLQKSFNGFTLKVSHLEFHEGKIYGLTGPNGSGKTTLLSILNLLEKPDTGKIFYKGEVISAKDSHILNIRRNMAMVLENPYLFDSSVIKNITYGLRLRFNDKRLIQKRAEETLALVNLSGFEMKRARELSRGETQRVAIGRAIVLNPEILFLDEPFTNIDKIQIDVVEKLIRGIKRRMKTTIIFTTHNLFRAYRLSDEILSLVNGRIVKGSIENLFAGDVGGKDNAEWVQITPSINIKVVTERKGKVHILVPPEDIILSRKPFQSSARNVLEGKIKSIEIEEETVRVCCDAGIEFIALITKPSFDRMQLSVGSPVYLTFKTTSVKVF